MSTVQIGQASALFGLPPATLRWWERQGVLGEIRQSAGRRRYDADDLLRIGLAYLCHVEGRMPLDATTAVTAGAADWRTPVQDQIDVLDRQITELQAARNYLSHLVTCTSDDARECVHLDGTLITRTPRGRYPDDDIVTAARR